jgi:hypothetical protein
LADWLTAFSTSIKSSSLTMSKDGMVIKNLSSKTQCDEGSLLPYTEGARKAIKRYIYSLYCPGALGGRGL